MKKNKRRLDPLGLDLIDIGDGASMPRTVLAAMGLDPDAYGAAMRGIAPITDPDGHIVGMRVDDPERVRELVELSRLREVADRLKETGA